MFRKRKKPVRDNTGSQVTMEQIRRRMVANVAVSGTPSPDAAGGEGAPAGDMASPEYPALPGAAPSYASAQQNLQEAREISERIAQADREAASGGSGQSSLGGFLRNSMRWYTAPEEAYWNGVLGSMDRILSALQAHDAVVKIHAGAIHTVQELSAGLTQQLGEIADAKASNPGEAKEAGES